MTGVATISCVGISGMLSPGGMVRKQLPRGPLDTLSIYLSRKQFRGVSILRRVRGLFENLENVLSPEGTLRKQRPMGSILILSNLIVV